MSYFNFILATTLTYCSGYLFIDSVKRFIILQQISRETSLYIVNWVCLTISSLMLVIGVREMIDSV